MAENTEWVVEIAFPRPYAGVEIDLRNDQELTLVIPFSTETSAHIARGEMEVTVRKRVQVVTGEMVDDSRVISGEVVRGELE